MRHIIRQPHLKRETRILAILNAPRVSHADPGLSHSTRPPLIRLRTSQQHPSGACLGFHQEPALERIPPELFLVNPKHIDPTLGRFWNGGTTTIGNPIIYRESHYLSVHVALRPVVLVVAYLTVSPMPQKPPGCHVASFRTGVCPSAHPSPNRGQASYVWNSLLG